jgi:hypothetical protein
MGPAPNHSTIAQQINDTPENILLAFPRQAAHSPLEDAICYVALAKARYIGKMPELDSASMAAIMPWLHGPPDEMSGLAARLFLIATGIPSRDAITNTRITWTTVKKKVVALTDTGDDGVRHWRPLEDAADTDTPLPQELPWVKAAPKAPPQPPKATPTPPTPLTRKQVTPDELCQLAAARLAGSPGAPKRGADLALTEQGTSPTRRRLDDQGLGFESAINVDHNKWSDAVDAALPTVHNLTFASHVFDDEVKREDFRDLLTHGDKDGRKTPMDVLSPRIANARAATDKALRGYAAASVGEMAKRYFDSVHKVMSLDADTRRAGYGMSVTWIDQIRDTFAAHAATWPTSDKGGPNLRIAAEAIRGMIVRFLRDHATTTNEGAFGMQLISAAKAALVEARQHVADLEKTSTKTPPAAAAATGAAAQASTAKALAERED